MACLIPLMPKAIVCLSLNVRAAQRQTIGGRRVAGYPPKKIHETLGRTTRNTRSRFQRSVYNIPATARLISSADRKALHLGVRLTAWSPSRRFHGWPIATAILLTSD